MNHNLVEWLSMALALASSGGFLWDHKIGSAGWCLLVIAWVWTARRYRLRLEEHEDPTQV